jgi:lysophospholipase L1-like esterase
MSGTRRLFATLGAALCLVALAAPAALAVFPNSMAATGDSITRAFNTCRPIFTDCPANSWATGTEASVNSFYLRILERNAGISGHLNNDAVSGAKMTNLPGQVSNAVTQRVEYVTIGMGANDVCTTEEGTMTSVASFRSSFESAIRTLRERLPGATISVGSIPNIYSLWRVLHTNRAALTAWSTFSICQSMLRRAESLAAADEERRLRVQRRELEFNSVLANVCATYEKCQYDRGTAYEYSFEAGEVSTNDYFHPSLRGQASIANIEWPLVRF